MTTYYAETGSTDPYYNLAYEEYLLTHFTLGKIIMLWQNDNAVVVGLNQNAMAEVNFDFVSAHNVKVVRRTTGGGAVYHDLGNLNYSFITDGGKKNLNSLAVFSRPVISALSKLGVDAQVSGRNDVTVCGKKISGTAQRIYQDRILHHGTLLFSSNPQMIEGALNVDKSKFVSKGTKSVSSHVGNIADYVTEGITVADFWAVLRAEIAADAKELILSKEEKEEVNRLADDKYRTWEWNYGKSPKYSLTGKARFAGGTLETHVGVDKGGLISGIEFFGDYMAKAPADGLTANLCGKRFEKEEIKKVLSAFDLYDLFGEISADEILSTMF